MPSGSITCFLLYPTALTQLSYRRFTFTADAHCAQNTGHNARAILGTTQNTSRLPGASYIPNQEQHQDPRWPVVCDHCDYEFLVTDQWQINSHRVYRRSDDAALTTLYDAPLGAMWNADWYPKRGPDGHYLIVRTPGGDWEVDGPSRGSDGKPGPGWTRTGTPPNVTARPSIGLNAPGASNFYHAFLTDGILVPQPDSMV